MRFSFVLLLAVFADQVLSAPVSAPVTGERSLKAVDAEIDEIRQLIRSTGDEMISVIRQLAASAGVGGRSLASEAADVVGIAVDTVYIMTTTLLYGASILRGIKWLFLIVHFIG